MKLTQEYFGFKIDHVIEESVAGRCHWRASKSGETVHGATTALECIWQAYRHMLSENVAGRTATEAALLQAEPSYDSFKAGFNAGLKLQKDLKELLDRET